MTNLVTKSCDSCAMCCKLLPINTPEISKPGNEWCKHWKKKTNCTIYESRPPVCRGFECGWLQNPELPPELRPDKCGAILKTAESGKLIVVVDPNRLNCWREGLLGALLDEYEDEFSVYNGSVKIANVSAKGSGKNESIKTS